MALGGVLLLGGGLVPDASGGVDRAVRAAPAGSIWQPASNSLKAGEQLRSTGLLPSTTKWCLALVESHVHALCICGKVAGMRDGCGQQNDVLLHALHIPNAVEPYKR